VNSKKNISYPYMPAEGRIGYVPADNQYMQEAKECARKNSVEKTQPLGCIIVLDGKVVGRGVNGSTYHDEHGCERVRLNIPTGQDYELCEGCSPKNHGEPRAIADAQAHNNPTKDADLYLWGHWWCCEPCWNAMLDAGIHTVYLLENSEVLFNKEAPNNIVGKQLA
jgi:deoxycytidylate deaminase